MTRPYWIGAGVVLLGTVWIYQALQLPIRAQYAEMGPGFFVLLVGIGLVLFGIALLVQMLQGVRFEPQDAENVDDSAEPDRKALLLAVAAAALPAVTMIHLGFILTATFSFALMTLAFGSRRYFVNLGIGFAVAVLCFVGFRMLGVQLGGLMPLIGA